MKKLVGSVVLPILGLSLLAGCAPTGGTAAVVNGVSIPDSRVTEATDGCASVMRDLGVPEGQMHLQVLRWAVFDEVARQFVAASACNRPKPSCSPRLALRVQRISWPTHAAPSWSVEFFATTCWRQPSQRPGRNGRTLSVLPTSRSTRATAFGIYPT